MKPSKSDTAINPEAMARIVATLCRQLRMTLRHAATNETIKWKDGKEYPVYKIEISAESHPFYTGKQKIVDTAGRVDKFKKRYARKGSAAKAAE